LVGGGFSIVTFATGLDFALGDGAAGFRLVSLPCSWILGAVDGREATQVSGR
jgi:hypothetical protein